MEEKATVTPEAISEAISEVIGVQLLLESLIGSVGEFGFNLTSAPYNKDQKEIHVFQGISKLAEILGCKVNVNNKWNKEYPYYLSFEHDGLTYFQLQETEVPE